MQHLEAFFHTATAFCQWAEGHPSRPDEDAHIARRLLSTLYAQAHALPVLFEEADTPDVPLDAWNAVYQRFGALPFTTYAVYLERHDTTDPSPGVGDLADDLADIWRDLKGGLLLDHQGNHAAAAKEWRDAFHSH